MKNTRPKTQDNRAALLDAARRILGRQPMAPVRVVDIAAEAGVNIALIKYYFGSKEGLMEEVVRESMAKVAAQRLERLQEVTGRKRRASVRSIMEAWLNPVLEAVFVHKEGAIFAQGNQTFFSPEVPETVKAQVAAPIQEVDRLYIDTLQDLTGLARSVVVWRLFSIIGSYLFTLGWRPEPIGMSALSDGECDPQSYEQTQRELIDFAVAAFGSRVRRAATDKR